MPAISIIVPIYNVENYLPQCIDSIRRQSFTDIEIVCVVDGGTDRSETIARLYEQVEPRMRVIVKENGGLSSARNVGIEAATGTYLMFVDSDDMLTNNACQAVYDAFQKDNAEAVTFGAWCYPRFETTPWHENNFTPRDVHYASFNPDILFKEESHPFVWRTAVAKDLLMRTDLRFDETVRFGEDQVFHFSLYPKAKGVTLSSKRLYEYRVSREGSLMATSFSDPLTRLTEHIVICDRICKNWAADGLMDSYGSDLAEWMADFLLPYCLRTPDNERALLVPKLHNLFSSYFDGQTIDGMDDSSIYKPVCRAFVDPQWSGDLPPSTRITFLNALYANTAAEANDTDSENKRSALETKLRTALPMSAAGLEWRLNNLSGRIEELYWEQAARVTKEHAHDTERIMWAMQESGACARALALLQCELVVKGIHVTL